MKRPTDRPRTPILDPADLDERVAQMTPSLIVKTVHGELAEQDQDEESAERLLENTQAMRLKKQTEFKK
jgi:hypothetical protein